MRPDDGAVDHVGSSVSGHQFGKGFQHGVEHAGLDPAPIPAKNAVPLAVCVRKISPLRSRPRDPQHALEIPPVILARPPPPTTFRRKQRPNDRPFLVAQSNPFVQDSISLQDESLNQNPSPASIFCPRNLKQCHLQANIARATLTTRRRIAHCALSENDDRPATRCVGANGCSCPAILRNGRTRV